MTLILFLAMCYLYVEDHPILGTLVLLVMLGDMK